MRRLPTLVVLACLLVPSPRARAQPAFPAATTLEALTAFPNFYHQKQVTVRGELAATADQVRLVPAGGIGRGVEILLRGGGAASGPTEVRGVFLDVGRVSADNRPEDLVEFVRARLGDRWPADGELLLIRAASAMPPAPPSPTPSLRQLSLDPGRYDGQAMSVKGQFSGRNLFGDLPQAPRISRTDFVIRNAGGAVWVTGVAPRGKGWQLDPDSKLDTEQWLQVEGTVRHGGGLVWLQAKSVTETQADDAEKDVEPAPPPPPAPPPQVIFSLPAQDDTDVPPTATVRIQTTRDLDPETFERHITVTYVGQPPDTPNIAVKATFDRTNRVLQLTFSQPLERFRTVKVELLEGIKGTDGQPLKPFTLTFSVGG
jgi:hypothetical protein